MMLEFRQRMYSICAGDKKCWSRRIYFPGYAWQNSREANWFYEKVREQIPSEYRTYMHEGKKKVFLDPKYHTLQGDRMVGSHKYESDNVLEILNEWEWEGEAIRAYKNVILHKYTKLDHLFRYLKISPYDFACGGTLWKGIFFNACKRISC